MFGKLFRKKSSEAAATVANIQNRDLMQGCVAIALLVAYANGDCSADELSALDGSITNNPSLKHFGAELGTTLDSYKGMMDNGVTLGRIKLMREIMDCASDADEKTEVFAVGVDIALSDGEIDEAETKVLTDIGKKLGVNLRDFGIE